MSHETPEDDSHKGTVEARFDDWLDQLEEAREQGQNLHPEDLCQDPVLLARLKQEFAKLCRIQQLLFHQEANDESGQTERDEATVAFAEAKSRVIGRYKLLQQIGAGGMGEVWMAQQTEPVRRRVALKLMHAGFRGKLVIARFEAERQALAMMDHPNIARIYDAGETEQGEPYFVMELVQGATVTDYCDQRKLSIPQRLKVFQQVCSAIQHAHTKGIIHRDIKPSNVMVSEIEGQPVVKVIDFGIAKALQADLTDKTCFTEFGQVLGTFLYMSPEQTEMNTLSVDTRTDVYSLGILLYKLLTGRTPLSEETLESQALAELLRQIRDQDTPRGSELLRKSGIHTQRMAAACGLDSDTLLTMLRGDLDAILMKATANERNERYTTPSDFSRDLQRYLNDEPVEAQPPSFAYHCRKFIKRHYGPVIAAAIVLVALLIGVIGTGWQWSRAQTALHNVKRLNTNLQAQNELATRMLAREAFLRAVNTWTNHDAAGAFAALQSCPERFRNVEWHLARRHFTGSQNTMYANTTYFSWTAPGSLRMVADYCDFGCLSDLILSGSMPSFASFRRRVFL